ncbi:hypothetical protein [Pararhizobium gei]|nr:hypothetical protein [Rhizobium gei]
MEIADGYEAQLHHPMGHDQVDAAIKAAKKQAIERLGREAV